MKKTDKKKIDIERLVIRVALISNLIIWVIIFLNLWLWHNNVISAYVTGWNLCSIAMMVSVSIAGHKNFKIEMAELQALMDKYGDKEDAEKTK